MTPPSKPNAVYSGHRTGDQDRGRRGRPVVVKDGKSFGPYASQRVYNHSRDGFEWGYQGSGPAQLALALLLDVTGDIRLSLRWYQEFKRAWVSGWTKAGWTITSEEIDTWLRLVNCFAGPGPSSVDRDNPGGGSSPASGG